MQSQTFSVSQLNEFVKSLLDSVPQLSGIYVKGELSNYKIYPSGHHYFTLKDQQSAVRCVMFRAQAARLRFRPADGMKVTAFGRVTLFPRDGAFQLYCDSLSPDGIGELYVAFEQLKEKLGREGLFAQEHKKPLPLYPETVAIITSGSGAAVHDMIRIMRRRFPLAKIKVLPVRVQGPEAPAEIAGAIRYACRYRVADVLITGRGGGSIEDLWAFNDERVARAIFAADIPIISAVGHEPDVTIADFVADARAATPTHAAQQAVPDRAELSERIQSLSLRMLRAQNNRLQQQRSRLQNIAAKRVLSNPLAVVQDKRMLLGHLQKELFHAAAAGLAGPKQDLARLSASLDALSPLKVLGRGYAMVTDEDGVPLRRAKDAPVGTKVISRLAEGALCCRVENVIDENREEKL
ncbi:MAG: exodeoxyribonuclease VII large subunit [Oscillospiraceae bacterium]|nr:exodeoxyribonuclease VII large subunit [Oscillospiraceae bacterium]